MGKLTKVKSSQKMLEYTPHEQFRRENSMMNNFKCVHFVELSHLIFILIDDRLIVRSNVEGSTVLNPGRRGLKKF